MDTTGVHVGRKERDRRSPWHRVGCLTRVGSFITLIFLLIILIQKEHETSRIHTR